MRIKLGLRYFKSFEDVHRVIPISMLFLTLEYTFNIITKVSYVPWTTTDCLERKKSLKQYS